MDSNSFERVYTYGKVLNINLVGDQINGIKLKKVITSFRKSWCVMPIFFLLGRMGKLWNYLGANKLPLQILKPIPVFAKGPKVYVKDIS